MPPPPASSKRYWSGPTGSPAADRLRRDAGAQQVGHVLVVEAAAGLLADAVHGVLELADRVSAALGVRVIRREQEHVVARLLDQPADPLADEGRDPDVAVGVLRRLERQVADRRLGLGERLLLPVEAGAPRHDPLGAPLHDDPPQAATPLGVA